VGLDSLPADYTTALLRGWEAHATAHNHQARAEFEKAAQAEPAGLGLAHEWAGMMAQLAGEPDAARAFWAAARARDPATWRARGYLADEALAHNLHALADTLLGEALAANAYEGRLWGTAARLRHAQSKLDSAERTSARAVRLDPTNTRILLNHGSLLWQAGLADTARIFWERALALDPGSIRFLGDFRRAPPTAPPPPLVPLYSVERFEPVAPGETAAAEVDSS
jgi:tetratricopeptide (TPR) repeat protein